MSPKRLLTPILLLLTLFSLTSGQTITYLSCTTSADCLHFRYPLCTAGACQPCTTDAHCTHLDATATCLSDTISNYCNVPCAATSSAGVCGSSNSICVNLAGLRCGSCQIAADCSTQYPTGVQCHTINSVGYCGYCLDDYQCSSTQTCKNFKCTECSADTDCPTNRPKCSITLKSNVCKCTANTDCPASKPVCTTMSSNSIPTCYSLPTMTLEQGSATGVILVKFNRQMYSTRTFEELVTIELVGVSSDLYKYVIEKLDVYTYQITLTPNTNIYSATFSLTINQPDDLVDADGLGLTETDYTLALGDLYLLSTYQKNAAESAARAGEVLSIILVSTSLFVLLISRDSILIWVFMNYLQSMYYILFINEEYPLHLQMFLRGLYMGPYRFLPNFMTMISDTLEQAYLPAPDRFLENNIQGLFLVNIGHLIFVWLITTIVVCMVIIIEKFFPVSKPIEIYFMKARQYLLWSGVLRVLLTTYNEFTFACFLQMRVLTWDTGLNISDSLLGIFGTILVCSVPFLFLFLLRKYGRFTPPEKQKYEMLMDEYNSESPLGRFFVSIALGKNLMMCIFIAFFPSSPLAVVLILLCLDILFIVLLGLKIHKKQLNSFITTAVAVVSAFTHMLVLSLVIDNIDDKPEGEIRIWTSWGIIATLLTALAVACTFVLMHTAIILRKLLSDDDGTSKRRLVPVGGPKVNVNLANYPLARGSKIRSSALDISYDATLSNTNIHDSTLNLVRATSNSNISIFNGSENDQETTFGKDPIPFKPLKPAYLAVNQKGQGGQKVRSSRHLTPMASSRELDLQTIQTPVSSKQTPRSVDQSPLGAKRKKE